MTMAAHSLKVIDSPLISLKDVSVSRGGIPVLRHLNADIRRGEITSLIGLNGSGKSTLLRTLLREFPYEGQIIFRCGHDHSRPRPEYVGYVPQRLSLDPRLPITVRDLLGLALRRWPWFLSVSRKLEARMIALLSLVNAENLLDVPIEGLSGGQLQRVLLALALEPHPELLLLDEPAAGIDFKTLMSFYEMIARINQQSGVTILLVSHDLSVVRQFSTNVLCLRDGEICRQGAPESIITKSSIAEIFGSEVDSLAFHPSGS